MGFRFLFPNRKITYSFAATSAAALLQVLSYVMPFWFIVHANGFNTFIGLFFILVCPTSLTEHIMSECKTITYEAILQSGSGSVIEGIYLFTLIIKIVAGVACGLIFGGFITLLTAGCKMNMRKWNYQIACVSQIISAILASGVAGFMAFVYVGTVKSSPGAEGLPWSIIIMGVGGIFSFVSFIIMCNALCNWEVTNDQDNLQVQTIKS